MAVPGCLSIHLLEDIWVVSSLGVILTKVTVSICPQVWCFSPGNQSLCLPGQCLAAVLLGHVGSVCLIIEPLLCFPTSDVGDFLGLRVLVISRCCQGFHFRGNWCVGLSHRACSLHFRAG